LHLQKHRKKNKDWCVQQAVAWYQKAANQGHAMSQYNLGWMYHQGRGTAIAQNFQQAKAWYQKVLAQPDTEENDEAKALARENLQKLEMIWKNIFQKIYGLTKLRQDV